MKRLMMGIATAAVIATAPTARAQAPFADVPRDHWAYDAVNTLAQRGLIIGYPDGTFGGKRAMTRYEFAVVIARMIPQLENYIKEQVAARGTTEPLPTDLVRRGDLANLVTREDFDSLRKLVDQFAPELQMLQVDVAGLRRDLNDLRGRVAVLEDEVGRVKINGEMTGIVRMSATNRDTLHNPRTYDFDPNTGYRRGPTDIDGRPLLKNTNLLEATQMLYNMDLGIRARVSKGINANALINIGNYMGGFSSAPAYGGDPAYGFGNFPYGINTRGGLNAEISPLKAYIEAPIAFRPLGIVSVEVGKTGVQFTPYTLKLVDYDSYTNLTSTDNGDVIFTGGKAKFRIGGVGMTAYAGTHGTSLLQGGPVVDPNTGNYLNPTGSGYPLLFTGGSFTPSAPFSLSDQGELIASVPDALFGGRTVGGVDYSGLPFLYLPVTQSAGVRATLGTPFGGTLGLTYMNAGINNSDFTASPATGINPVDVGRGQVFGADLALNLSRGIGLSAEYSNSNLFERGRKFRVSSDNSNNYAHSVFTEAAHKLNEAYDARLTFGLRNIALSAGYKRVEPFFGAPGAWGSIGRWKNPTNIKGWVGTVGIPLTRGLAFAGSAEDYRSIVAGFGTTDAAILARNDDTKIMRWTAGFKFDLTSNNRVDLGVESVLTRPNAIINPGGNKAQETFYNLGFGSALSDTASFKLLYQIIDYRDKGANFLSTQDTKGSVAVGQFTVKF